MLERALIDHGSPTLANLKVGSLFTASCADRDDFREELHRVTQVLASRGVTMTVLRCRQEHALVYVYRAEALLRLLNQPDIAHFLHALGYQQLTIDASLSFLQMRLAESPCFPHEIGVFLGYPLSDVIAFMRNGGRGCLCTGCWKVYTNECEALRIFERYRACRNAYQALFRAGWPLEKLTVRA